MTPAAPWPLGELHARAAANLDRQDETPAAPPASGPQEAATPLDADGIRRRHQRHACKGGHPAPGICRHCNGRWPCDAIRALDERDRLAAENASLRRQLDAAAAAMFPRMRSDIAKLEAERDAAREHLAALKRVEASAEKLFRETCAERDRYRQALERCADEEYPGHAVEIARAALEAAP